MANLTTEQMLGNMRDKISQTFARQDGFYETMGVGTAVNLAGQTQRTDDAMYRKSGGSEEVATGLATIANIKGNTVAWNQRIYVDFLNNSMQGYSYDSNTRTGTFVSEAGGSSGRPFKGFKWLTDHHYLACIYMKASENDAQANFTISTNKGYIQFTGFSQNWKKRFATLKTIAYSYAPWQFANTTQGIQYYIKDLQIFDLTLIYGAGNEPTTHEQFEADYFKWFGKPLTYDDYDEGSLRSVQLDSLKTTGFNQYNNGSAKVIGGIQYQITGTYTSITLNDETITPDANGLFTPSTTGTLTIAGGGSDTCVHISGDRNGEYEPYEEHVASIPVTTLKGKLNGEGESVTIFPNGMRSAGDVHDEIYTVGDKTYAVVRVGSVDLGTRTWEIRSTTVDFFATTFNNDNAKDTTSNNNAVCGKYVLNHTSVVKMPDKTFNIYWWTKNKAINIEDSSYTDATTFKTAMNGVMLHYEFETPFVYEVDDFALPKRYLVDGGGTEEQVQKANVQGLAAILTCIYGVDAVKVLDNLPKNYISEASMDNFLAQLNTATGGVWTKTFNENSGEWDFSYTPNAQTT